MRCALQSQMSNMDSGKVGVVAVRNSHQSTEVSYALAPELTKYQSASLLC